MITFEEIGITSVVLQGITDLGFQHPMPIQEKVIPLLLDQETPQDLIGLAQTGTGKTAAFGLPIIQRTNFADKNTQALILAPTRELCLQITGDLKNFAKYIPDLHIVAVYGGADIKRQIRALKKGAQIIVATPGRMNDLLNKRKSIDLSELQTLVLDEADEMLNMGFKEELDAILEQTPGKKTTLLFSATMPKDVLRLSKDYMREPREVSVGERNAGAENVRHICYPVRSRDRYLALKRVVDYHPNIYGIVFCRTRQESKEVAEKLIQDGYNADALHGDLSQAQREYIMQKFRIKNLQLLVATDVAARGLDVKDISHVINYNLPDEDAIYTHRSGRTGRAGQKGVSIAIVNLREKHKIKFIEAKLKKQFEIQTVPRGEEICEKQLLNLVDKMEKIEVDHKEIDKFLPVIYEKLEWLNREELIKHFVSLEFNRFLDYYRDLDDLNAPEEERRRKKRGPKGGRRGERSDGRSGPRTAEEGFTRFYINLGYKDSLTPRDLIGLINRCSRNRHIDIGRIDLMKTFSFFEVRKKFAADLLSAFRNVEYNRREVRVQVADNEHTEPVFYEKSGKKGKRHKRAEAGARHSKKKKRAKY
ncbi:DEAD/DEAH box helicase [candidate division KSB3 bacterium]|uniref:DEAD/DEAH box helicase n=1 Tax=candidate division KSB3 bacterium TaxID=2044937 RepID=A0A2G6E1P8_9BACT|nr:MAG: DEAD/DEAH box helicase [candidate division KSB3 bacterium]PIE28521.1 MAG: DEAD/DEAH box helicase [candidate division KSB3 bacterium]